MRPRSVPEIEFLSLISQLIKGLFAGCRHAAFVGHDIQDGNATMGAHLAKFQFPRLKHADDECPAHAEDLGGLLRRQLNLYRSGYHSIP